MQIFFHKVLKNIDAATAIEYALLAALVAVAGIVSFESLGLSVEGLFISVDSAYENRANHN